MPPRYPGEMRPGAFRAGIHGRDKTASQDLHRLAVACVVEGWAVSPGEDGDVSDRTAVMLAPWAVLAGAVAVIGYRLHGYRVADRSKRSRRGPDR